MNNEAIRAEALSRAQGGQSLANYAPIFRGFMAKGIPENEIKPRENVFTYNAWKALGRQVKKGEHGVKCITFIETRDKKTGKTERRPWTTTVFHVTQTQGAEVPELDATPYNVPYAGDEDSPSMPEQREMPERVIPYPDAVNPTHADAWAVQPAPIQPEVIAPKPYKKYCEKCGSGDLRHPADILCPRCKALSGQQVSILDLIPTRSERTQQRTTQRPSRGMYNLRPTAPTTKEVEF